MMFCEGRYSSCFNNDPGQRIRDPAVHAKQWQEVMKWDFEYGTSNHEPMGVCGPIENDSIMKGEGGIKGHMERELEKTGELNNTPIKSSWFHWRSKNGLQNALDKEAGYVKAWGPPEELRFGGPNYGPDGLLKNKSVDTSKEAKVKGSRANVIP